MVTVLALLMLVGTAQGTSRDRLTITSTHGDFKFFVELADEPEERRIGLMHRKEMAVNHGMLFLFERIGPKSFWMKNTHIPLDMLFLSKSGVILQIESNAQPGSLRDVRSNKPVLAVLEINGGLARKLGIRVGDSVRHKSFGNE